MSSVYLIMLAQSNKQLINGISYNPDGIPLTYVEVNEIINGFFIGKYELTQAQWEAVMGSNPSYFQGDDLPVENVSWNDTKEFFTRLNEKTGRNYRLPTEAEWVYAACGGSNNDNYQYSGSNNIDEVAWYKDNSKEHTNTVGSKKPNSLGIYDMSGNVWEWCEDMWDSSTNNYFRVNRGGGWNYYALSCSISNRSYFTQSNKYRNLGFRVVLP